VSVDSSKSIPLHQFSTRVRTAIHTAEGATSSTAFDAAFAELFSTHIERIYRIVHRMSGDADLSRDLVQDAFVRLYRRGSMPDVPGAWLVTVALNLYRNETSTRRRRKWLLTVDRAERAHSDATPAPDRPVLAEATQQGVRTALNDLPARERQMLLMRAEGYSYREIAVALDVHEASVGTLLARAARLFREHYHDDAHTP
jgi:RNA polymerase sigma-70 factor (ECF subfamily)